MLKTCITYLLRYILYYILQRFHIHVQRTNGDNVNGLRRIVDFRSRAQNCGPPQIRRGIIRQVRLMRTSPVFHQNKHGNVFDQLVTHVNRRFNNQRQEAGGQGVRVARGRLFERDGSHFNALVNRAGMRRFVPTGLQHNVVQK